MKLTEKYVYGHCYRPVRLNRFFDITKQDYVQRDVPCGTCYHCRMTKVNEWTTRMRLQSATYKYTYFVTLTISPDAPAEVLQAHNSVRTTINANKRMSMTPTCLDKPTVQKFLKRLRRYNDLPSLTYFLVGEYGHKYGRPHYHAIFWSDEEISLDMLKNAWHLGGKSIGDIDYHCIMIDGRITDTTQNAKNAFGYVCKYLQKQDFDWYQLPTIKLHYWYDYWQNAGQNIFIKNQKTDELEILSCNWSAPNDGETWSDLVPDLEVPAGFVRVLSPDYIKLHRPFMLCSRTNAIGGRYFAAHASRFAQGDFRLFGILDKNLVFPSYFLRRAKAVVCPYFPLTKNKDYKVSVATSSCHLPTMETLCHNAQGSAPFLPYFDCDSEKSFRQRLLQVLVNTTDGNYFQADLTIYDKDTHTYLVYNGNYFDRFQYSRKVKDYVVTESVPLCEILEKLDKSFKDLLHFVSPFDLSREINQRELECCVKSDFNGSYKDFEEYRLAIERQIMAQRADRQIIYKHTKNKF